MNAVEIEEAVSELAAQPFEAAEFPFAFLRAFGRKDVELQRLRKGNASDVPGGVLRRDSLHMATCAPGGTGAALAALRASPKTTANRVKFIVATDGVDVQAEECAMGEVAAFPLAELGRHFGFFLPLAGISAVKAIKDNPIDVKAVGRLNKLYVELLRENPNWAEEAKRPELNRLMSRLVFCFFAEDTGIFRENLFTATVQQMSDSGAAQTNTDEVLRQLFLAMATPTEHEGRPDDRYRVAAGVRPYIHERFPFVNGGLFEDAGEVPRFSRAARNYLLRAGELDWREINPDIFGSMIQAVAEDDERASLGMHYTSVPNILKVLNPLFLDDLRNKLSEAGDSVRKLRALRRRIGRIRVFDPACGSGNFLVIAYRHMREIEHGIIQRTGDDPKSVIPLTNFYGIEIKDFAAEIARLALLIAEFQADSRLISQQAARSMVLPLHRSGQIHTGNALRMDWLEVCPPAAPVMEEWDLGGPTGRLALEENGLAETVGPETYVCANPPYKGYNKQTPDQKSDLELCFSAQTSAWRSLDYVAGWLNKFASMSGLGYEAGFVTTNSICQGEHASILWPLLYGRGVTIGFAVPSFKWSNNAANNAGVTVSIVGLSQEPSRRFLYVDGARQECVNINQYLVPGPDFDLKPSRKSISSLAPIDLGNMPKDGGNLLLSLDEAHTLVSRSPECEKFVFDFVGSQEFVKGIVRNCLWIEDSEAHEALSLRGLSSRLEGVAKMRSESDAESTRDFADRPHRFKQIQGIAKNSSIVIPKVTSESRPHLPVGLLTARSIISDNAFALYDAPLWNLAIVASKLHLIWIATVCGKLETRYRYSNTFGWNTFPVPRLTDQDKTDLTRCAEGILLAREAHFPATIADMYDPERMDRDFPDLRAAHERNDETLERIYIGRRFRNDTERLEHLFALYTKMTASDAPGGDKAAKKPRAKRKTAA